MWSPSLLRAVGIVFAASVTLVAAVTVFGTPESPRHLASVMAPVSSATATIDDSAMHPGDPCFADADCAPLTDYSQCAAGGTGYRGVCVETEDCTFWSCQKACQLAPVSCPVSSSSSPAVAPPPPSTFSSSRSSSVAQPSLGASSSRVQGASSAPQCGNGICSGTESTASCSDDCYCGDDTCDTFEQITDSCPADCPGGPSSSGPSDPECGDGLAEGAEECDADDFWGATCQDYGYDSGELSCDSCIVSVESCQSEEGEVCGNGEMEGWEECDDGNTDDGDGCSSECGEEPSAGECGNGVREGDEQCDGDDLGGQSCESLEFGGGTLACSDDCELVSNECATCGNGVVEGTEACDGALPGNEDECSEWGVNDAVHAPFCESDCSAVNTGLCEISGGTTGGGGPGGGATGGSAAGTTSSFVPSGAVASRTSSAAAISSRGMVASSALSSAARSSKAPLLGTCCDNGSVRERVPASQCKGSKKVFFYTQNAQSVAQLCKRVDGYCCSTGCYHPVDLSQPNVCPGGVVYLGMPPVGPNQCPLNDKCPVLCGSGIQPPSSC